MPVPLSAIAPVPPPTSSRPRRVRSLGSAALLLFLAATIAVKPLFAAHPPPTHRILLEGLGFQPISSRYLLAGSSMLTVHYVDETHLLVTFAARRLIHRIANDPPTDEDRNVDALLLDLPSGHVVARTEWLLHDHGQYLWNLGHGHFLLRVRDTFTTFAPIANFGHGQSFSQIPFLNSQRHIVAVLLAPDRSLLTVESTEPPPLIDGDPATSNDPVAASTAVQLNFYRLSDPNGPEGRVVPRVAGGALARQPVDLPITSAGILNVLDQGRQRWAFDFHPHAGKTQELGLYDSTCRPSATFVSPSEFISFGCHGGSTRQQLAAFNLRGDEMWEQTLYGSYIAPHLEFSPASGRFALSRVLMASAAIPTDTLVSAQLNGQTVDVYQTDSGKPLLHLDCTPIARAGQNFALSPDGMDLAIVREGAIEIYRLPSLTPKDKNAIKLAEASAPPPSEKMVDLSPLSLSARHTAVAEAEPVVPKPVAPPTAPVDTPPAAQTVQPASTIQSSTPDMAEPEKPRKPPTLYSPEAPNSEQPHR
jgi:hypothetical protein